MIGAVTGGLASTLGHQVGELVNTAGISSDMAYLATHTAGGAVLSGTTGAVETILTNV